MRRLLCGCSPTQAGLSVDDPRVRASARRNGSGCPCLSFSASPDHEGYRRRTRSGDSAAKHFRRSRQPPGSGADAEGFRRAWPCACDRRWIRPIRSLPVAGSDTSCPLGFSLSAPQRSGSCSDPGGAADRRCAQKLVPNPRGQGDWNVGLGSNLLCLVWRSARRCNRASNYRRGASGVVGRGDRPSLARACRAKGSGLCRALWILGRSKRCTREAVSATMTLAEIRE